MGMQHLYEIWFTACIKQMVQGHATWAFHDTWVCHTYIKQMVQCHATWACNICIKYGSHPVLKRHATSV